MTDPPATRAGDSTAHGSGAHGELDSTRVGMHAPSGDPRLVAELRLLGTTGFLWTAAAVHAGLWAWATGLIPEAAPSTWALVAATQLAAFGVVVTQLVRDLPPQRWRGGGGGRRGRIPLIFVPGALALPFVPLLWWRAKASVDDAPPEQLDRARAALLQLPRVCSLRLLSWASAAYAANAVILGLSSHWPGELTIALTLLWVALVGPVAAIAYGWARAILRPEYVTAPAPLDQTFTRTHDMRLRLVVGASIASAGAIVAPLAAGYLWLTQAQWTGSDDAVQLLASEAMTAVTDGDSAQLAQLLTDHPTLTVIDDGQTYGAVRNRIGLGEGQVDDDGDGTPDAFIARQGRTTAIVSLPGDGGVPTTGLWFCGLSCLGCCVVALSLVAADLNRDVGRANEQVKAVAEGRAPPAMSEQSLSSLEIRELVQSVDRLVGRITEANIGKYIAIEKAKEADRLKSQFLANMSHDLRSPLNSVLGFSELLLSGIDGDVTAEQAELLQEIHDSGRHLLQQIDDILDTAKIEAGRLDLHPEPTPPATLLTRAIQNAKRRRATGIEYSTEFAAGLPPAFIDPYRGVQALENVLLFAGERIETGTLEIRVRRGASEDRRMIFMEVTTPERPATAEQLAQARRGFFRIPGHRGLGLGLPIAGSIVELSGGSMGIEDFGDQGMQFSLMLPAPEARRAVSLRVDPRSTGANPALRGESPTEDA